MKIIIVTDAISKRDVEEIAKDQFGDMVKAVVDVAREIMAVGGELHADAEAVLLENGSRERDLWGINLYPEKPPDEWIKYDSMINVRPAQGNRSRNIEDSGTRERIRAIVRKLIPI